MTLGNLIKSYREEKDLSLEDFAKLSGLTRPYIWMLEKNKNTKNNKPIVPSLPTLKKVANALNISLGGLLEMLDEDYPILLDTSINVTDIEREHLEKYRALSEANREVVDCLLDKLFENDRQDFVKKESQRLEAV